MMTVDLVLSAAGDSSEGPGITLLAVAIGVLLIVLAIVGMFGGRGKR